MLCLYCQTNECAKNAQQKELKFCSKSCQNSYTIKKRAKTNLQKYGYSNPMKSAKTLEKRNQTNLKKYGVTNPFSLKEIQEKQQNTCLEKYGVLHASQSPQIQEKIKQSWQKYHSGHPFADPSVRNKISKTLIEKYGVQHPILSEEICEKIRKTCLKLYGVNNASKNPDIAKKISTTNRLPTTQQKKKQTTLDRYGVEHFNQQGIKDQLQLLNDSAWLQDQINSIGQTGVACLLQLSVDTVRKFVRQHNIELPTVGSDFERSVISFIKKNYHGPIELHNRSILGQEVDIFLPDLNLAIECNGSYWHSDLNGRSRSYHNEKLRKSKEKNVNLINVWEHHWETKKSIVQSRLLSLLKANQTIAARKLKIIELDNKTAGDFLNKNHIQGHCGSTIRYGLVNNEKEILAIMTFGKSRYNKTFDFELIRFCNKVGMTVVGGASRLFRHFVKNHPGTKIISYSDRSFNTGNLYKVLGFAYYSSSAPSYQYTKDYKNFTNRVAYQKHKLASKLEFYDPQLSEWDNMKANGFDRIWDCGTDVWHYLPED